MRVPLYFPAVAFPMSLILKLGRLFALDRAQRLMVTETLVLSACIFLGFRLFGVPRTQDRLRKWVLIREKNCSRADENVEIGKILRAQGMVRRATGLGANCLVRSMTLWAMLMRRGLSPSLRVGFRKRDGRIQGHAWVEHQGVPINERQSETATFSTYAQSASFDFWWKRT
jgi:hypothetical protein